MGDPSGRWVTGMRVRRIYIIGLSLTPSAHVFIIIPLLLLYADMSAYITPSTTPSNEQAPALIISCACEENQAYGSLLSHAGLSLSVHFSGRLHDLT